MLLKLAENRVYRSYTGGGRIDALVRGVRGADGCFPEDWLASTVEAFNPGREQPGEGLGHTVEGRAIRDLLPEGLPILVKLLDAAERLVIQVHPTRSFAKEFWNSPVGKTECWYILDADETACVYIGFREHISREAWERCYQEQDVAGMLCLLHRFEVRRGDCIFVPGGVPHAIGGGCLMVETQEPSDLMVIPERFTPSGKRLHDAKLHGGLGFERMLDCFLYEGLTEEQARLRFFMEPVRLDEQLMMVVDGSENGIFSVMTCQVNGSYAHAFEEDFAIAVVVEGRGEMCLGEEHVSIQKGDRLLITQLSEKKLHLKGSELQLVLALPAK